MAVDPRDVKLTVLHRFEPEWARVISGENEGVYGWIALNYQTANLAVNPMLAARRAEALGVPTTAGSSVLRFGPI